MVYHRACYINKCKETKDKYKLVKKDRKKKWEEQKVEKKISTQLAAKYTVHGFALALQFWAYEAIANCGKNFAINGAPQFLRMLV